MSQIKIYGLRTNLKDIKQKLSDVIHNCIVESLSFPKNKRAHRFINLEKDDFFYPEGRTDEYIIIHSIISTYFVANRLSKLFSESSCPSLFSTR